MRFLAVLELYKQGLVELDQAGTFGDLEIVWLGRPRARPATARSEVARGRSTSYEG